MDAGLQEAVEHLYQVFEPYPLRPSSEPCLHCHEPDEERVLHEHALRKLDAHQLSGFATEAMSVWGNDVDFKHFLPRILEITVVESELDLPHLDWPDTESLFRHLADAHWRTWPDHERRAVERFLNAYWLAGLNRSPSGEGLRSMVTDIGSMVTALVLADVDLKPFLHLWLEQPGEAPLRHLAEFANTHATLVFTRNRLSNAFWGVEQREAANLLKDWIRRGRPRHHLIDGFFHASTAQVEQEISSAVKVLEALEALPVPGEDGRGAPPRTEAE